MLNTQTYSLQIFFHALTAVVQGAIPLLAESKGCIVNISSVGAHRPDPGMTSYAVSKAGLDMLTRSSAQELAGKVSLFRSNAALTRFISSNSITL